MIEYEKVRIRFTDETDIEWASEQNLMGADDVFGRDVEWYLVGRGHPNFQEPVCEFIRSEAFKLKLSDEHSEIKEALGGQWAYCHFRPYPRLSNSWRSGMQMTSREKS